MRGFLVGMEITRNKGIGQKEFFTAHRDEGALETDVTGFDAFDFFSGQDKTSLVLVSEGVIKMGTFVGGECRHHIFSMSHWAIGIKFCEKKRLRGGDATERVNETRMGSWVTGGIFLTSFFDASPETPEEHRDDCDPDNG